MYVHDDARQIECGRLRDGGGGRGSDCGCGSAAATGSHSQCGQYQEDTYSHDRTFRWVLKHYWIVLYVGCPRAHVSGREMLLNWRGDDVVVLLLGDIGGHIAV